MNRYLVPGAILDSQNLWLANQTYADDVQLILGSDDDWKIVMNTASISANAEVAGLIEGVSDHSAYAANSLLITGLINNGDVAIIASDGGNSKESFFHDASSAQLTLGAGMDRIDIRRVGILHIQINTGKTIFNEDSADIDFRVEGLNNPNSIVSDAGQDNVGLGAVPSANTFLHLNAGAQSRAYQTSVGWQVHVPADTLTATNASSTDAIGAAWFIGIPTLAGDNATYTITDPATLHLAGAPVAGSQVAFTNAPSALRVASGNSRFDGRVLETQGADVSSADEMALGVDGNYFDITGSTTINHITNTGWLAGSVVFLQFDASVTVTHNSGSPTGTEASLLLAGAGDFSATAGDTLTLVYDGTTFRELARTVI